MFHLSCFKKEKGITLAEVLVVIFIIALFSSILVSDFPKIKKQFALSRATYRLLQDFRKAQDMGFSVVQLSRIEACKGMTEEECREIIGSQQPKSYGIFIDLITGSNKQYIIYADKDGNQQYDSITGDYIIETINLDKTEKGVIINEIINTSSQFVDVNFMPPNPNIEINPLETGKSHIEIVLAIESESDPSKTRRVSVNTSGLIEVK